MSKIRVYELAREYKLESKFLMGRLKELGIVVASHQSTLTSEQITLIKKSLQSGSTESSAAEGATASKAQTVIRRRRVATDAPGATEVMDDGQQDDSNKGGRQAAQTTPVVARRRDGGGAHDYAHEEAHIDRESTERDDAQDEGNLKEIHEPAHADYAGSDAIERKDSDEHRGAERRLEESSESDSHAHSVDDKLRHKSVRESTLPVAAKAGHQAGENESTAAVVGSGTPEGESAPVHSPGIRREKKFEKPGPQGATIVRRASPEEVQARKVSMMPPPRPQRPRYAGGGPSNTRTDDEGGNRGGYSSGPSAAGGRDFPRRPPPPNAGAPAPIDFVEPGFGKEVRNRNQIDKKKYFSEFGTTTEEENRKAIQKQRRDSFNVRQILSVIEERDDEVVEGVVKKRTVYTPSASNKKKDLKRRKDLKKTQVTTPRAAYRIIKMGNGISVAELGKQLGVKAADLIKKLMSQGVMASLNQEIDLDVATLIASEYGFEVQNSQLSDDNMIERCRGTIEEGVPLVERPPIVTIMGHVDHGKTSILDAIRQANVAAGEAGGITQHIGAYTVKVRDKTIAFLDTPGHEAFSAMRARGAQVTDIVVLVVAADDGVMPQTVEAIAHAKEADVPIIVAINKIDKPNINLDRINSELMTHAIQAEEWGGEHQFVKVSALEKRGIDDLLEAILIQAEVLELQASPSAPAAGIVVEANLDKGRGPVATVMVQNGTLRVGDVLVAGTTYGKVRALHDHKGTIISEALPSTPVEVVGLAEVPKAGDRASVVVDEKFAKELVEWRIAELHKKANIKSSAATLEKLLSKVKEQETPEVPIIVKADTQGSVEALSDSIMAIKSEKVNNRIVSKGVGGVSESDISLAAASQSIIVAFNVRAGRGLDEIAEQKGVPIRYFSVIYDVVDALKAVMAGTLPPIVTEVVQGHAEVRQTIKVPKVGVIAGTAIVDGKITRNSNLRLIRDDVVIYSGKLGSLRRFKDDVREVLQGYECGIGIEGYNDIREGDIIESYVMHEEVDSI